MVKRAYRPEICAYLRRYGVTSDGEITRILAGFDFEEPIYLQPLSVGETYYQFVRTSSNDEPGLRPGCWFCLAGAEMNRLAIHSPNGPRILGTFQVVENIIALEGIARDIRWVGQPTKTGVGGSGGGTQIYVPPVLKPALRFLTADI
jgi:hypothetical protein